MKYPAAKDQIAAFGLSYLSILTAELVRAFSTEELFPKLFYQWLEDYEESISSTKHSNDQNAALLLTQEMFLKEHGIRNFSIPTCWRWINLIGFTYSIQQKSYYVDGHERGDVVSR